MRASEFLIEYRDRLLQYVKSLLPTWPEYVLKDWLVPNKGDFSNLPDTELKNGIMEKLKGQGLSPSTKWQLVPDMKFTMDMFEPITTQRLVGRAGGKSDLGMKIPKDAERHATQAALAQQQGGVRKEPVLLIKTANGYELLEGWHRTIQHFARYPNGYTGPAYVAVAQGQQGVAEGSEHYNGIEISMEKEDDEIMVKAIMPGGRELGHVLFVQEGDYLMPQDLEVDERYQGQGIAATMYDYIKSKGYKIRRSGQQTDAGAGFWDKHRPEQNVWENFADGKNPGRKGLSKRVGIPKKATLGKLEKIAQSSTGERRRMAQWQLNMRRGKKK
jgi:GNAT superfamily N-acetyltransferase